MQSSNRRGAPREAGTGGGDAPPPASRERGAIRVIDLCLSGVRWISLGCGILAAVLLLAAVAAVCHLVIVRYVLVQSAIWQHEFVTFSLIGTTLLGSPYVLLRRGHVNVDLLPHYVGPRTRFALAVLASLVSLAFCTVLAWTGYGFWHEALARGWHNETVWAPPLWIPYLSMPLGLGLLALQSLADLLALLSGRAPPFGMAPGAPR